MANESASANLASTLPVPFLDLVEFTESIRNMINIVDFSTTIKRIVGQLVYFTLKSLGQELYIQNQTADAQLQRVLAFVKDSWFNQQTITQESLENIDKCKVFIQTNPVTLILLKTLLQLSCITQVYVVCSSNAAFLLSKSNVSFAALNLPQLELKDIDLSYADFSSANLQNSRFTNINLTGADFTKANLIKIDWRCIEADEVLMLRGTQQTVQAIAISPSGLILASSEKYICKYFTNRSIIKIWNIKQGRILSELTGKFYHVTQLQFFRQDRLLLFGTQDFKIKLWDVVLGKQIRQFNGHKGGINQVLFLDQKSQLISCSSDRTIRFWSIKQGRETRRITGHTSSVRSIALSPNGKILASGSFQSQIRFWNIDSSEIYSQIDHDDAKDLGCLMFSPNQSALAVGFFKILKSIENLKAPWPYETDIALIVYSLRDFTKEKGYILTRLWVVRFGNKIPPPPGYSWGVQSIVFTPDGSSIITNSRDKIVLVWNAENGNEVKRLFGHQMEVSALAMTLDGVHLASGSCDHSIRLWSLTNNDGLVLPQVSEKVIVAIAFSSNSELIACGQQAENSIELWNVKNGTKLFCLSGFGHLITDLHFSHDGHHLVSRESSDSMIVLDLESRTQVIPIPTLLFSELKNSLFNTPFPTPRNLRDPRASRSLIFQNAQSSQARITSKHLISMNSLLK